MSRIGFWLLLIPSALVGCADQGGARPHSSAETPSGSASAPRFTRGASSAAPSAAPAPPSAAPSTEPASEPAASASAAAESAPLPKVEVTNIGMHIGGETNTAAQKKPIREAVHKHYDDFRRCYGKLDSPPKEATFGVDMRIEGKGGPAKISNPRNTFEDNTITSCLVDVFESVDFAKPKKGIAQMVSFSLRFRRK